MSALSFPSKTFLVGEYAALEGADALLLGHPPLFRAELIPGVARSPFHPESPAGLWLKEFPYSGYIEFHDAHHGLGGFGGSGAEFLTAWSASRPRPQTEKERHDFAWTAWRDSRRFPGSGADILTQAYGVGLEERFALRIDFGAEELEPIELFTGGGQLSLFHTGRKLSTHEHLHAPKLPLLRMAEITAGAAEALRGGNFSWFAREIASYGECLKELGLLATHSAAALDKLRGKPGVLAAKGCGAMGADVLLVAHEPGIDFSAWCKENSLAPVGSFPV